MACPLLAVGTVTVGSSEVLVPLDLTDPLRNHVGRCEANLAVWPGCCSVRYEKEQVNTMKKALVQGRTHSQGQFLELHYNWCSWILFVQKLMNSQVSARRPRMNALESLEIHRITMMRTWLTLTLTSCMRIHASLCMSQGPQSLFSLLALFRVG